MNYLFFDIECADGNRAICEYGYVLTDENFNIIRKRNILIDPECRFNLTGRKGQDDLILTYPYEEYYKYYPFDDSYEIIKKLMTQEDLMIFGHAVNNDIGFIFKDCLRYKLPLFDYTAYDVQMMLPIFSKENKRYTSLENAFVDLVAAEIRNELKDHRACDDAFKTMLVFKAMIKGLDFKAEDLIDACPKCKFDALKYWEDKKIKKQRKDRQRANKEKRQIGKQMWNELTTQYENLLDKEESIGKFITISAGMKEHTKELSNLINVIKEKGFVPIDAITGSDYFVVYDDNNRKEMLEIMKYPYVGKMLTYNEFVNSISDEVNTEEKN